MHDRLFANQQKIAQPDLPKHAEALGLDVAAFDKCMEGEKHAARIRKDMALAQSLQVTGTPTFFLGLTDPNGSQIKGVRMSGAQPYPAFKDAVERLLSSQK